MNGNVVKTKVVKNNNHLDIESHLDDRFCEGDSVIIISQERYDELLQVEENINTEGMESCRGCGGRFKPTQLDPFGYCNWCA